MKLPVLFVLFILSFHGHAQHADVVGLGWLAIEGTLVGDDDEAIRDVGHFRYLLEVQLRTQDGNDFQNATVRPFIGYDIGKDTTVWIGYAFIPFEEGGEIRRENRLIQMLTYKTGLGIKKATIFVTKTKLEQRHIEDQREIAVRIRQLAQLEIPLPFVPKESEISLFFSDEVLINLNDTEIKGEFGAFENRFKVGLTKKFQLLKSPAKFQVYYLNRNDINRVVNHEIGLGLSLNPQWGLGRKKRK